MTSSIRAHNSSHITRLIHARAVIGSYPETKSLHGLRTCIPKLKLILLNYITLSIKALWFVSYSENRRVLQCFQLGDYVLQMQSL